MRFAVKDTLTEDEIRGALKNVINDGLATRVMVTLTGGVFLVAFALKLGASNSVIGLLAAIPSLVQLIQIPSVYLVEKYRVRRAISVYTSAISRISWLFIALIPFLFSIETGLIFLISVFLLKTILGTVSLCSWNSWMRDLLPQDQLGVFFSKRMRLATALGIPVTFAAGFYLDYWKKIHPDYELYGYSLLFFLGFLAGMLGVYFLTTIPEPRMPPTEVKVHFYKLIMRPFKDDNFRNLVRFLGSWNFAVNLAAPFFTVYMLKRLELDMSLIIALTVLSQLTSLAFYGIWGRFSDRFSNKSVLSVSGPLFILCILAWTFTTMPDTYILTMPLLIIIHIFMGISTAGVTLASGNIGLKLAPKGQATAYLAANSLVNSISAGIAPILGGSFVDFFNGRKLAWDITWTSPKGELVIPTLNFQQWDFFFFFAFLVGLYSIHLLALVKEEGEVEEKIVLYELLSEIRRPIRNFSTADGLQQMVQFPFSIVRSAIENVKDKKNL
jgi:MFS family permease